MIFQMQESKFLEAVIHNNCFWETHLHTIDGTSHDSILTCVGNILLIQTSSKCSTPSNAETPFELISHFTELNIYYADELI